MTELRAGHFLEGLTHHLHTIDQEGDGTQKLQYNKHKRNFTDTKIVKIFLRAFGVWPHF